jgi:hypothetical protein
LGICVSHVCLSIQAQSGRSTLEKKRVFCIEYAPLHEKALYTRHHLAYRVFTF